MQEPREALCECRDRRLVCGNDNQTYNSECKLRETAYTTPELSIAAWGPCVSSKLNSTYILKFEFLSIFLTFLLVH